MFWITWLHICFANLSDGWWEFDWSLGFLVGDRIFNLSRWTHLAKVYLLLRSVINVYQTLQRSLGPGVLRVSNDGYSVLFMQVICAVMSSSKRKCSSAWDYLLFKKVINYYFFKWFFYESAERTINAFRSKKYTEVKNSYANWVSNFWGLTSVQCKCYLL